MLPSREDFLLFRFDEIENETLEVETWVDHDDDGGN
jgi:hypothetical protein